MSSWANKLREVLLQRKASGLYRQRKTLSTAQAAAVTINNQSLINFSSNDYLGLANDPRVVSAMSQAANRYGAGSGASHLVVGHSSIHHQLEERLAAFLGRDRALLFSSGYMANLGVLNGLLGKGDAVFQDKLNHASLIDGGLSSGADFKRFMHRDLSHLDSLLEKNDAKHKLIVTDSVFSMDGDIAPLSEISHMAKKYGAILMVDDAHGFGVLGTRGAGCAEAFSLTQASLPIVMGTLGKSAGVFGAFVAGSHELIETLIQQARTYIYTTALPPACAGASLAAIDIIESEPERRQHLQQLITVFKAGLNDMGLPPTDSSTPIQPVIVGDNQKTLALSEALLNAGLLVAAIRPPTVPAGTARLRISFSASHSFEQLEKLLDALKANKYLLLA